MQGSEYPFIKNNIHFRMLSSSIIAAFKSKQAQDLQQVTRHDVKFAEPCREVLLLEYERVSRLLLSLEYVCLKSGSSLVSPETLSDVLFRISRGIKTIETVIAENIAIFGDIGEFVKLVHEEAVPTVKSSIENSLLNMSGETAFMLLSKTLSDYIEHVLLCLHEYNSVCFRSVETPFICVSNFDKNVVGDAKFRREKYLKDRFNIVQFEHHDYTSKPHNQDIIDEYQDGDEVDFGSEQALHYAI